ncbi:MAG: molybdopterin-dependent oxidoreductase [SAR324 cluster bacterium]|nr:molybdopterin-dependent oxidoreductase [SAR324 cluster bacterium]
MSMELPSVCTLDCPDTCSLTVTVEDGKMTRVRGSHANPYTRGVICNKVTKYPEFVHGEGRIKTPLKRVGAKGEGRFEPISWDAALDLIYERFTAIIERYGAQAIAPLNYAGPHGMLAFGSMDMRFFNRLGASQLNRRAMCGGIRSEAFMGTYGAAVPMRPEHVAEAELIIVWGNNVTVSNLHLTPDINAAKKRGAKVVVIDPVRVKIAEQADMHLALLPGTDVVLAWAIAAELERVGALDEAFIAENVLGAKGFMAGARQYPPARAAEICGLPEDQIVQLAEWYRTHSPAVICIGNGLERNRNGGSGLWSIFALPALAGKFGVRGGGVLFGSSASFPKTVGRLQGEQLRPEGVRTLNILDMGKHLLDKDLSPPLMGLFVYNHNPVIVHPEQSKMIAGLSREDLFTVVADLVMTDSADYADVVLPNASNFEHADLYPAYGQQFLQRGEAVIPLQGEALPNTEMFRRLAARFGFGEPEFSHSDEALMDQALDLDDTRLGGVRPSEIPTETPISMTFEGKEAQLFKTTRPVTPSGKVELESSYLNDKYGLALPRFQPSRDNYPLYLISPSSDKRTTSTFGGLSYSDQVWIDMHPSDAGKRELEDGMMVRVWNDLGEVHLRLKITDAVRPGVVCSLKGAWFRTSGNGRTVSVLAPAHKADLAEGACYNDTRVEVAQGSEAE